jgi:hypothetical protein
MTRTYWLIPASRPINRLSIDLVKVGAAASCAHILIVRGRIMGRPLSTPVGVITVGRHRCFPPSTQRIP